MKRLLKTTMATLTIAAAATAMAVTAQAAGLLEKLKAGETIRIGFANEIPWAYPGENNKPLGFVNAHAVAVLKKMAV